jgi:hypothetical protein
MSESLNLKVVVSRFERHLQDGLVSVHFYIQHPTIDVCTTIPAILPMEGSDNDIAQKGWEIVFPQAVEWVRTTTAPVAGRQFVVALPVQPVQETPTSTDTTDASVAPVEENVSNG